MVAEVAFNYLDETTKKNVLEYLGDVSIEDAANWMDKIKSNHTYDYMKPYHYADFAKGTPASETNEKNIIKILKTILKDFEHKERMTKENIKIELMMLFHLIGDLHQPLHVGYSGDHGGNDIKADFFGKKTNLHAVWDSEIISKKGIRLDAILSGNTYSPNEVSDIQKIDVVAWANDSRKNLDAIVYDYKLKGTEANINQAYIDKAAPLVEKQVLKGGLRLAAILKLYFSN
ncbi:S1/P1 nuclease [Flavobacterium sp. 3HN19-14]|uniref:S1/P1 nuclease n=1 Tax=Flavobacterium sp. 3HN19-14 TaxID=3448133 RepID=UPI003EE2A5B2